MSADLKQPTHPSSPNTPLLEFLSPMALVILVDRETKEVLDMRYEPTSTLTAYTHLFRVNGQPSNSLPTPDREGSTQPLEKTL